MHEKKAKIVSLVPSWTETLLVANLNVVGRTRFCIHPAEMVSSIPAVGGTKNPKIDEIIALRPDFVVLDKEENKKELAEALQAAGIEILVSHVTGLESAAEFLDVLGEKFSSTVLGDFAAEYRLVLCNKNEVDQEKFFQQIVLRSNSEIDFRKLEYVIWKKPFMVIGRDTFIAEVLKLGGVEMRRDVKYPEVSDGELKSRYCLFSTEPYPFEKEFLALGEQGFKGALVDGEKVSWYGVRNLRFLQSCIE